MVCVCAFPHHFFCSVFLVDDGYGWRWLANTQEENLAFRASACRKDLDRCYQDRRPQGMDLQILFGNEGVDEVEVPQV